MSKIVVKDWVTEAGYRALVLYIDDSHNCGYVLIPKTHPYSDDDYEEHYNMGVHGGLTFAGKLAESNLWAFGFDAAHSGDKTKYWLDGTFRDTEYMAKECERLAKQLRNADPQLP